MGAAREIIGAVVMFALLGAFATELTVVAYRAIRYHEHPAQRLLNPRRRQQPDYNHEGLLVEILGKHGFSITATERDSLGRVLAVEARKDGGVVRVAFKYVSDTQIDALWLSSEPKYNVHGEEFAKRARSTPMILS